MLNSAHLGITKKQWYPKFNIGEGLKDFTGLEITEIWPSNYCSYSDIHDDTSCVAQLIFIYTCSPYATLFILGVCGVMGCLKKNNFYFLYIILFYTLFKCFQFTLLLSQGG